MKQEKRIPTILGLFLLIASTVAGVYLTSSKQIFNSKASIDCRPDSVQVSNISEKSASIYFSTSQECSAQIKINGRNLDDYRLSSLNYSPSSDKLKTHFYQVDGLKDSTLYKFEIISGGQSYTQSTYQINTALSPSGTVPVSNLAWGKVYTQSAQPAFGSIVFINIPGAAPLSAVVTSSGNWNISFATSFNSTLESWYTPPQNVDEEIIVISDTINTPTVLTGNTSRNNPVPDITLGQNYFTASEDDSTSQSNYFNTVTPAQNQLSLSISYPKEGETVYSLKPEFIGTAAANSVLTAKFSNSVQEYKIQTNSQGNWTWTPSTGMIPGLNTLTITDSSSTISRNFTIETGSGLAFEASSSVGLGTTPTQIPTSTLIPTSLPSQALSTPTLIPTSAPPTSTPTIIRTQKPRTESGLPTPGTGTFTALIIAFSLLSIIISLQLIKKSDNFK